MKTQQRLLLPLFLLLFGCQTVENNDEEQIRNPDISQVLISDPFWSPRFEQWTRITSRDVLDKFEGKHTHTTPVQTTKDAFRNFDRVADGERGTRTHTGFPWFDGLVYETIRGLADLLAQSPDEELEARIDGYIDRIYAAQQTEPSGYIETYTLLTEPDHRWGENGGFLRWQHDVYNAGMLVEAGIHYYQATGKTKLLEVATRFANHMVEYMGPAPRKNVVPSHSGPEEAMMKLYWLYKNQPGLKKQIPVPVQEEDYYDLVSFWIENRGNNCGFPLWLEWGNQRSEQWIRDTAYTDARYGADARPSWGDYAQDSLSVFEQQTIEGHAVRATLLGTGIAATAIENHSPAYIRTASVLWDNMVGRRMFITGGVGAIHHDEKFGPDYFLPTDAYLETCAAVGVGFFSQRMNELTGEGKYMDEFERVLYNNILTGISLSGDRYTYQNPLNAEKHARWEWHDCPCCPPMFLKIVSALPAYIYAYRMDTIYVNLFIGSETAINLTGKTEVGIKQQSNYPWDGKISLTVDPEQEGEFSLKVRIPGWAQGKENPYALYSSNLASAYRITVNNEPVDAQMENGYALLRRPWAKGDRVEVTLPMQPRIIRANPLVTNLQGQAALASGPVIYCLESCDNPQLQQLNLLADPSLSCEYQADMLNGVNVIRGKATDGRSTATTFTAIPFYAVGNREQGAGYKVWLPQAKE